MSLTSGGQTHVLYFVVVVDDTLTLVLFICFNCLFFSDPYRGDVMGLLTQGGFWEGWRGSGREGVVRKMSLK